MPTIPSALPSAARTPIFGRESLVGATTMRREGGNSTHYLTDLAFSDGAQGVRIPLATGRSGWPMPMNFDPPIPGLPKETHYVVSSRVPEQTGPTVGASGQRAIVDLGSAINDAWLAGTLKEVPSAEAFGALNQAGRGAIKLGFAGDGWAGETGRLSPEAGGPYAMHFTFPMADTSPTIERIKDIIAGAWPAGHAG